MDFQAQLRHSLATLHLPPTLPPIDKDNPIFHLGKTLERYAEDIGDAELMRVAKLALHGARLKAPELLRDFANYYADYVVSHIKDCLPSETLAVVLPTIMLCCVQAGYAAADIERRGDKSILAADMAPVLDVAV